jgi:hypothetical protein
MDEIRTDELAFGFREIGRHLGGATARQVGYWLGQGYLSGAGVFRLGRQHVAHVPTLREFLRAKAGALGGEGDA